MWVRMWSKKRFAEDRTTAHSGHSNPAPRLVGDLAGDLAGKPVGDLAGEPAGDLAGEPAGDLAGEPDDDCVGGSVGFGGDMLGT